MANKSGKKLAPTKKEWEQSASRLAGGIGGSRPYPSCTSDSGGQRQLQGTPASSLPFPIRFIPFPVESERWGSCAQHLISREEASG